MRVFKMKSLFMLFVLLLSIGSCVSVELKPKTKKASNIHYKSPQEPFKLIKTPQVDSSWQSEITGNSIAFISDCDEVNTSTLKKIEKEMLTAMTEPKTLNSEYFIFKNIPAIKTQAEGSMDGVEVKMSLLIFRKNQCNFIISYLGRKTHFTNEILVFDKFVESFESP